MVLAENSQERKNSDLGRTGGYPYSAVVLIECCSTLTVLCPNTHNEPIMS